MDSLTPCPPWLHTDAKRLMGLANKRRVHHAQLISGISGIGKRAFCHWLAASLLCRERSEKGWCGDCPSCQQLLAKSHPDYTTIVPEGSGGQIKVDRVRDLIDWMQLTAGQGSYRVALIDEANALNHSSANSLLKTLEEPSENAVLILCADKVGALPATIRSRCQKTTLHMSDVDAAISWLGEHYENPQQALSEAQGAPFAALAHLDEKHLEEQRLLLAAWTNLLLHKSSVGKIADSLSALGTSKCLATFARWSVLAAKKNENLPGSTNVTVENAIAETHHKLTSEQWFTAHDLLLRLHRADNSSFRTQAVLEGILADMRLMVTG